MNSSTLRGGASACATSLLTLAPAFALAQQTLPTIDVGAAPAGVTRGADVATAQTGDRVTGYNADKAPAAKLDKPILQTPIAVQVVTRQMIDDRQAISINDAVVGNVSSASLMPTGCTLFQNLIVRGFPTGTLQISQVYRNGLLTPNLLCPSTANVQSIDVVKGPAAMAFGRIEPGGLVDVEVKRPLETPYYSVMEQAGSYGVSRTTVDATGPITKDKSLLYRVTGEFPHNPSIVDFVTDDRWFGSGTITYHPIEQFKLNVDVEFQDTKGVDNNPNVPAIGNTAAAIRINRYLADPSITVNNPTHYMRRFAGFDWTYQLDSDWSITNRFNYSDTRYVQTSIFLVCVNTPPIGSPNPFCPANADYGQATVTLNYGPISIRSISGNLDLKGKLNHSVLFGTDHSSFAFVGDIYQSNRAQSINVFAPNYQSGGLGQFVTPANGAAVIRKQEWQGFYAQDMISAFDQRVHFLIGGRYDIASAVSATGQSSSPIFNNALARADAAQVAMTDHAFSPRIGLVLQPYPWLSFYGNYTKSFGLNNGVTRAGVALGPQTAIQMEGGIKAELLDKRLSVTLAYYDIKKYNIAQNTPSLAGALRGFMYDLLDAESKGVEIDVAGRIDDNWSVIANFSHMNTHVTKGSTLPASDRFDILTQAPVASKRLPAVPENMGNLWVKYDADGAFRGWSGAIGASRVGTAWVDPANGFIAPAYTSLRAMASYRFALGPTHVTAQVNVDNLLNSTYIYGTSQFPGRFAGSFGAPRSILGSLGRRSQPCSRRRSTTAASECLFGQSA